MEYNEEINARGVPGLTKKVRTNKKNLDPNSKIAKYYAARKAGKTFKEAQLVAGYSGTSNNIERYEGSKAYKLLLVRDSILQKMSLDEITDEHIKMIKQDDDKGAKNTAIKMAYERIEPDNKEPEQEEKVMVILKG